MFWSPVARLAIGMNAVRPSRGYPSGRLSREKQPASEERVITVINTRAQENRKYVQRLLREKLPEFAAMLESAERQLNQELWSHLDAGGAGESQTVRRKDERGPLHLSAKGRREILPIFVTTLLCASARSGDGRGSSAGEPARRHTWARSWLSLPRRLARWATPLHPSWRGGPPRRTYWRCGPPRQGPISAVGHRDSHRDKGRLALWATATATATRAD